MDCCKGKNLVPIIYKYNNGKDMMGVSHFVCVECMSNICVDDSLDRPAYPTVEQYAKDVLWRYDISEYKEL